MTVAYPLDQIQEEVGFIAYHFHWPLADILELAHADRVGWVGRISKINERILQSMER